MSKISDENSQKIKNLSIICALFVVTIHGYWPSDNPHMITWWVDQLFTNGISRIAVPFFFTVSGFL